MCEAEALDFSIFQESEPDGGSVQETALGSPPRLNIQDYQLSVLFCFIFCSGTDDDEKAIAAAARGAQKQPAVLRTANKSAFSPRSFLRSILSRLMGNLIAKFAFFPPRDTYVLLLLPAPPLILSNCRKHARTAHYATKLSKPYMPHVTAMFTLS